MTTNEEKSRRLLEAATAVLAAAPRRELNVVSLNKALFYLDLQCLRDLGETLTRNTYMALDMGPVVAFYKERLIAPLEKAGLAVQNTGGDRSLPVALVREPEKYEFATSDVREWAKVIAAWVASQTSRAISERSHKNPGWQIAMHRRDGGTAPKPINMLVAMQELLDADPWLDEPPDDDLRAALAAAEASPGEAW